MEGSAAATRSPCQAGTALSHIPVTAVAHLFHAPHSLAALGAEMGAADLPAHAGTGTGTGTLSAMGRVRRLAHAQCAEDDDEDDGQVHLLHDWLPAPILSTIISVGHGLDLQVPPQRHRRSRGEEGAFTPRTP